MSTNTQLRSMPDSFDFNDISDSLRLYLSSVEDFRDVNWSGSAASMLVRLLAYNTQMNQVGNSFIFNEIDINTAVKRDNVASIASSLMGYLPKSKIAAEIIATIVVIPDEESPASSLLMPRDTSFFASLDGRALNFSPDGEYETNLVNGRYTFENVRLLQGEWFTQSFPVQTEYGLESYQIPNSDIDLRTIRVGVLPSQSATTFYVYEKCDDLFDLGPTEKRFFLRRNSRGAYTIEFGDDRVCRKVRFGEVVLVDYLITDGSLGNGLNNLVPAADVGGHFNVEITPSQSGSSGGDDEETIDSIKRMAPLALSSQGNAVSENDFVFHTKEVFPEAQYVASWGGEENDPPKYGYQIVAVKAFSSDFLTDVQKADIVRRLTPKCVGSITPIVIDPDFTYIHVNSNILYSSGRTVLNEQSLRVKVIEAIREFSKTQLEFFGSDFIHSSLVQYISETDQSFLGNVTRVVYEKRFSPIIGSFGTYKLKFNVELKPTTISITGFRIQDSDFDGWSYSLVDDGQGRMITVKDHPEKGRYQFDGFNGDVDYTNGVVNINNFRPISFISETNQFLSVIAEPGDVDPSLFNNKQSLNKIDLISIEFANRDRGAR